MERLNLPHKPFEFGQRQMEKVYQVPVFQGEKWKYRKHNYKINLGNIKSTKVCILQSTEVSNATAEGSRLQFNCADILNTYIANNRHFSPAALYPMKKEPSLIVQPQDLASNSGSKSWLWFCSFWRLWENDLTPNGPVLMLINPTHTLWYIEI